MVSTSASKSDSVGSNPTAPVSIPLSSNGRTTDFGSVNRGSNPRRGTLMPIATFKIEAHVFYIARKCELCSQEVQSLWVLRMRGHKIVMCNACKKRMILALTSVPYPAREYAEQIKASIRTEGPERSGSSD